METINNGTFDNDPSAEAVRVSFEKTKDNFAEITALYPYKLGEEILDRAISINDEDDLYAHDSRVLVVNYVGKEYILIAYQCDKVTKAEWQKTQHFRLIIYDRHTRSILQSIEVAKGNTTYGAITLPDYGVNTFQMIDLGTGYVRMFFNCGTYEYYRDVHLTDYSLGTVNIFQVHIRNAANDGWDATAVDFTIANINTHCTRTMGGDIPTGGGYTLLPVVRSMDQPQLVGGKYYLIAEAYYANAGDYGVSFLMESSDLNDWYLYPPIALDLVTYSNNRQAESTCIYLDSKWRAISRWNNYLYSESADGGLTWSAQVASGLINPNGGSRMSGQFVNIRKGASTYYPIAFYAYNKDPEIYKADAYSRVTMALSITEDMQTFEDIAIINNYRCCHYPSLHYFNGLIFMTFTTSERATNTDRNTIMFVVFNPWRQLKV